MAQSIRLTVAMQQYERHLRARGLASNTVKNHLQALRACKAVWGDILLASVTPAHIDALFSHHGWSESTRNLYLSTLNGFIVWAQRHRYMARDGSPTDGWRNMRVPRRERLRVPVEQFPALLAAADHPRDRAVIALGLFTFLRGGELAALRVSDLDLSGNRLHIWRQKTREADTLPVSSELGEEMASWLAWYRQDQGAILRPNWFLVPAKDKPRTAYDPELGRIYVDRNHLAHLKPETRLGRPYTVAQRALAVLDYDTHQEGEHTLRRSGARALADALRDQGYDGALMRVASMLGHKDTRITEKYIGWEMERDLRNRDIAGKAMFPSMPRSGEVVQLRRA